MPTMKNLIVGNNTYNIIDDEAIHSAGGVNEGVFWADATATTPEFQIQSKHTNGQELSLKVQDNGWLTLYKLTTADDWTTATTLFDVNMKNVAYLNSPQFTGTPTAPTNTTYTTSNTQIATTAFVQNAISRRLPTTRAAYAYTLSAATSSWATHNPLWTSGSAGIAIGYVVASFPFNATGRRAAQILVDGTAQADLYPSSNAVSQVDPTKHIIPFVYEVENGTKIGIRVWQNSGSTLSVSLYIRLVVITE